MYYLSTLTNTILSECFFLTLGDEKNMILLSNLKYLNNILPDKLDLKVDSRVGWPNNFFSVLELFSP